MPKQKMQNLNLTKNTNLCVFVQICGNDTHALIHPVWWQVDKPLVIIKF